MKHMKNKMKQIATNIDIKPFIDTNIGATFDISIIRKNHPHFNNWILSELTLLYYDNKNNLDIHKPEYGKSQLLNTIESDSKMYASDCIFQQQILEHLITGYPCIIETSEPSESGTQKVLIYGYIYEKKKYLIMCFNKSGNISHREVDERCLYDAADKNISAYFIKRNDIREYPINWQKLSNDLKTYYYGRRKEFIYKGGILMLYGLDAMNRVIDIFDSLRGSNQPIDIRFLSVIYEHKKILEYKFKLLLENGIIFKYKNISEKLNENTVALKECLNLLIKYNTQRNQEDIALIEEKLNKIICIEDVIIPIIIDEIDGQRVNKI